MSKMAELYNERRAEMEAESYMLSYCQDAYDNNIREVDRAVADYIFNINTQETEPGETTYFLNKILLCLNEAKSFSLEEALIG